MRQKSIKRNIRVSVTIGEAEYAELARLATDLDLSAAWMIRRAVSEFVTRHGGKVEPGLPLRPASKRRGPVKRGEAHEQ